MNLTPINSIPNPLLTQQTVVAGTEPRAPGAFSAIIAEALQSTNNEQAAVDEHASRLMTGEASNFHELSLAVARADLAFQFTMAVRDQLVGAYREVMKMQV